MTDAPKILSLSLVPSPNESSKPAELIRIRGHEKLTLNARRAITILWHNAHRQGVEPGKRYTIEIDQLMSANHKGHELALEAIRTLMTTLLIVDHPNGTTTWVQFLGGTNMHLEYRPAGVLTYKFDDDLVDVLKDSTIWGKIPLSELAAFSSKYTISLFENLCQLTGLTYKTSHTYELGEFRQMLGVERDKYPTFSSLNQRILKPSTAEINALAQFNMAIVPIKTGKKVTHVRLSWWDKTKPERQAAYKELTQPRVGRRARISNQVEMVFAPVPSDDRRNRRAQVEVLDEG